MKQRLLFFLAAAIVLINGCQKEKSFEQPNNPAEGSLQSDVSGDCLPKSVNGTYEVGTALVPATNTISVEVNVVKTGTYLITTDTVNGFYFTGTGVFANLGTNSISLRGNGTPFTSGTFNFVVSFDSTQCDIQVTVLPAGSGGPAVFTLEGAPNACTGAVVAGSYAVGTALTSSNTATISVNVTTIGTYNISTTFQGMTFAAAGAFITTGVQTVQLNGSGTPTTGGVNTVPVTVGTSTCSFPVNVSSAGAGTLGGAPGACTPATVNGTYAVGTALTATNTVQIQVNITTAGVCNITTNTVAGFSFSFSGNLAAGTQTVTLTGTGTPSASGSQAFTVTFGTSTCTFNVTVTGTTAGVGTLGGAPGTCTPATVNGTYTAGTILTAANTVQLQVNITTAGTCNISTNTVTGFSFAFSGNLSLGTQSVTLTGTGTPTTAGAQTFTVTFGTSTCTFTVTVLPALSNDYFPRTANSNWSYEFDDVANDSLYRNATSNTITVAGNPLTIFMQNDGTGQDSSGYYRKNGGDYFEWFDFGSWVGLDNPAWTEYILLKDNVAANTSWTTGAISGTVTGSPISIRLNYKIEQKDVPITINASTGNTTYQNVIVVLEKLDYSLDGGATWLDATSVIDYYGKSYYARGIGLIKFEAYDAANTIQGTQELRRYQVF